ncbi:MAG: TetR/AcrR family transcriptional regulator [Lachnospiraceae bacterium]
MFANNVLYKRQVITIPKDKTDTFNKLMPCIKAEFLEKGFEKASIRAIAKRAGMSASGIYRHFKDKEAMFDALVAPLVKQYYQNYQEAMQRNYALLDTDEIKKFWMISEEYAYQYVHFLYDNFDEFKLVLTCSEGTKYQSFLHDIVDMEVQEMTRLMDELRNRGFDVRVLSGEELHMLISGYVASYFEVVIHGYSREEALAQSKVLIEFLYPGWIKAFGMEKYT